MSSARKRRQWTPTEIARACGVTRPTVAKWMLKGWLPSFKTGRRKSEKHPNGYWRRALTEDVEALLRRRLAKVRS